LFLFFYGSNQFGLVGADEPRYAQVAREMLERHDWVTPVLGGQPWLEKPPLYYWQAMLAYSVFGVKDWAARLPSALDATLLVLAMYFFLRRFRRGWELDGALITASAAGVVGLGRAAATDMPLAATFSIALIAWWTWRETGAKAYLAAFYALLGLGMLAKGPVAPVLAGAVILLYAWASHDMHAALRTLWLPGIVLFLAVGAPWYVLVQMRNPDFFRTFIIEHNLARFSSNIYHHRQPFWFYGPVILLATMPWTLFVIAAVVRTARLWWTEKMWRKFATGADVPENGLSLFALTWLLVPVAFFSISQSKLPAYILPAVPAVGLLLAEYIRQNVEELDNQPPSGFLVVAHGLLAAIPVFPALLIQFLITQHRVPHGKPALVAAAITVGLAVVVVVAMSGKLGLRALRFATMIPVVLTIGALLKLGGGTVDDYLSARPLAAEISSHQPHAMPLAVYGVRRETDYGLAFYRNQPPLHPDLNTQPRSEYLLVVPEDLDVAAFTGRRAFLLGSLAQQRLDYYWIPGSQSPSMP
jgi:4-amino-4-deoxy-L-arabinose transferase-like glycosyltransferase